MTSRTFLVTGQKYQACTREGHEIATNKRTSSGDADSLQRILEVEDGVWSLQRILEVEDGVWSLQRILEVEDGVWSLQRILEVEDGVWAYLGVPDGVKHLVLGHGEPVFPVAHLPCNMHTRLTVRVTTGQWDWGSYIACRSTYDFANMFYKRNKHDKTTCRLEIDTVLQDSIGLVGFVKCARQY